MNELYLLKEQNNPLGINGLKSGSPRAGFRKHANCLLTFKWLKMLNTFYDF